MSRTAKIRNRRHAPFADRKAAESFRKQPVAPGPHLYPPEEHEPFFVTLYLPAPPYLAGLLVIFLFIARNDFAHFLWLEPMLLPASRRSPSPPAPSASGCGKKGRLQSNATAAAHHHLIAI